MKNSIININKNDAKTLGIYVHIPFCVRKCNYCDFLSFAAGEEIQKKYADALIKEICCVSANPFIKNRTVSTVFFGGGTPSVLAPELLCRIMETIQTHFTVASGCEATVECNPGTLDTPKAVMYRKSGFNRISLGLQSTDNRLLKGIGRIHTYEAFLQSYDCVKRAGFDNINIDMMQALPGQDYASYTAGLEKVVALRPSHISAYSLIIEEGTHLYNHLLEYPPLPDEEEERRMYYATGEILEGAGYRRYEISNYAREGFACRHNITYWERGDYLGLGLGASSLLGRVRTKNIGSMEAYIAGVNALKPADTERFWELPTVEEQEWLSQKDAMAEFMFLGLRMMKGVSALKFVRDFDVDITEIYGSVIDKNIGMGLLEKSSDGSDTRYRLTQRGIDVSNRVMAEFLL